MKQKGCTDVSLEDWALAVQLYRDQVRVAEICKVIGRSHMTVRRMVRQAGLGPRHYYRGPRQYLVNRMLAQYPPELHP